MRNGEASRFEISGTDIIQDSILPNGQNQATQQPLEEEEDVLSPEYFI